MKKIIIIILLLVSVPCFAMTVGKSVSLKKPLDNQIAELNTLIDKMILVFSGRIAFCNGNISHLETGENIDGQFLIFTSLGADTETTIAHTLGRTPSGYIIVSQDKASSLYHASADTAWTSSNIYLKSSTVTTTYTIFIF